MAPILGPVLREDIMKKIGYAALAAVTMVGTGCAGLVGESMFSGNRGRVLVSADTEGMRAFGDMISGAIVTGKSAPNVDDSHHQLRRKQEDVNMIRYQPVGE